MARPGGGAASAAARRGNVGFPAPPDGDGRVELGYGIVASERRKGYAREAIAGLTDCAVAAGQARVCVASVSPRNSASLALVRSLGFRQVGEQVDEVDGLELSFERALPFDPGQRFETPGAALTVLERSIRGSRGPAPNQPTDSIAELEPAIAALLAQEVARRSLWSARCSEGPLSDESAQSATPPVGPAGRMSAQGSHARLRTIGLMQKLRVVASSLSQRRTITRWHARCVPALRFAWLGWRLGALRERLDDRREALARALGR